MGIILHKINKKQFLPTKNSVAHVSCHSSSQNVGAHRQLIFIEQLRERERFLKLVYSIPSKKNVLASVPVLLKEKIPDLMQAFPLDTESH